MGLAIKESWDGYESGERIFFSDRDTEEQTQETLDKRIAAIFSPTEIADRWTKPEGYVLDGGYFRDDRYPPPEPFKLNAEQFLNCAYASRPIEPEATVSAFAQWLYSLYSNAYGDEEDRERGIESELGLFAQRSLQYRAEKAQSVAAHRRRSLSVFDDELRSREWSGWKLVHCGLHLQEEATTSFSMSDLPVGRLPLRASPDLLYQNVNTGEVIVVEIKNSTMQIPSNLWPNIWGQLWCYAQIPLVREASRVMVVGEVWGTQWHDRQAEYPHLYMRASVRRDPRAAAYDRFFRALFEIYRGAA